MATIEELQAQLAALTARVDVITTPPETYYTMQYQGETIDRLLSMAPDNLLDNVNFCNPVNQRGVSGTISTPGFFIDRWYLVSGSAQITSAGLVLNGTMQQTREFAVGAPTTASALTTSGVVAASYDDSTKVFTLTGTGQTFVTAKLELGSVSTVGYQNSGGVWVPTKTLKYSGELRDCQRFLYSPLYKCFPTVPLGNCFVSSTSILFVTIPLPVAMASRPTFVGDYTIPWIVNQSGGGAQKATSLIVQGCSGSEIMLAVSGTFDTSGGYIMYSDDASGTFAFSCEI